MLELKDISKSISGKILVRDVNFSVEPGELMAITGPSGSGKTTLLRCIMGIDQPVAGTISLAGEAYSEYSPEKRRDFRLKNIGVVDQDNQLIEDLTCRDNIRLIAEMSGKGRKQSLTAAQDILAQLHMEEYGNRYPKSLSGGERQRISIGCALANTPSLIAADEPTSSLDDKAATVVLSLFHGIAEQFQIPVVIVTHDNRVTSYASSVYKIGDNRVFK